MESLLKIFKLRLLALFLIVAWSSMGLAQSYDLTFNVTSGGNPVGNAQIYIDGVLKGGTSFSGDPAIIYNVASGNHTYSVENADYQTATGSINVT